MQCGKGCRKRLMGTFGGDTKGGKVVTPKEAKHAVAGRDTDNFFQKCIVVWPHVSLLT